MHEASAWRAEGPPCGWVAFADQRDAIDRLAKEHVADTKKIHAVTIEPGPGKPPR
jgi:hypothetical protein